MSLVGPRPLFGDEDEQILSATGRSSAPSRLPLTEMVKLDYLHVAGCSLWSDVKNLLRTLPHVWARRGL